MYSLNAPLLRNTATSSAQMRRDKTEDRANDGHVKGTDGLRHTLNEFQAPARSNATLSSSQLFHRMKVTKEVSLVNTRIG